MISVAKKAKASELSALQTIGALDLALYESLADKLVIEKSLSRSLVSFQANKKRAIYRWYKYKEAFSASLLEYLFERYRFGGHLFDPFAGSGTALFAASEAGMQATGIELLPIGQQIIEARRCLNDGLRETDIERLIYWITCRPWEKVTNRQALVELRITKGAYPAATQASIERYLAALQAETTSLQTILRFALLCVLESVSYTRKDGQYLRWDWRSGRKQGQKPFDKGEILSFNQAIAVKLHEILSDIQEGESQITLFPTEAQKHGAIHLHSGSCLDILPTLPAHSFDGLVTSPPYCNRYDYTRTYALELALLGTGEAELIALRQAMLSCTVENRGKNLLALNPAWEFALTVADRQELLQAILLYLEEQKAAGILNNNGIPRMVRGYFYEMACVIAECARVLKPGAPLVMVNDNVRYAGASVSVDLILSAFAEKLGFIVENILILPDGKGNSSQQMGAHGKETMRKCVYVWRRV